MSAAPRCECGSFLPAPATCAKCGHLAYPEPDTALAIELLEELRRLLEELGRWDLVRERTVLLDQVLKARDLSAWAEHNVRRLGVRRG